MDPYILFGNVLIHDEDAHSALQDHIKFVTHRTHLEHDISNTILLVLHVLATFFVDKITAVIGTDIVFLEEGDVFGLSR